ncbi:uncharacterized protein ARMOST_08219 [Armillaria ostoyae]|uniref:Uncharacterized protein n=1 Tax=Armillaria ostoyae TaxID=47428 RepID=A0A284R801_ARMOS|nr:uncharacterized protein ARMOST_08219 [Armillaria ostoyae]
MRYAGFSVNITRISSAPVLACGLCSPVNVNAPLFLQPLDTRMILHFGIREPLNEAAKARKGPRSALHALTFVASRSPSQKVLVLSHDSMKIMTDTPTRVCAKAVKNPRRI